MKSIKNTTYKHLPGLLLTGYRCKVMQKVYAGVKIRLVGTVGEILLQVSLALFVVLMQIVNSAVLDAAFRIFKVNNNVICVAWQ